MLKKVKINLKLLSCSLILKLRLLEKYDLLSEILENQVVFLIIKKCTDHTNCLKTQYGKNHEKLNNYLNFNQLLTKS
jgi:hypothetical protein